MKDTPRRTFIKGSLATGLTFGLYLPDGWARVGQKVLGITPEFTPNAFVRIGDDDTITIVVKHLEMGQGVYTGIPTILAEELEVDLNKVVVESAPADATLYNNLFFGAFQGTGGSTAIANSFDQLRKAGAVARETLRQAAAKKWGEATTSIMAKNGKMIHNKTKKSITYGELVATARKLKPAAKAPLKKTVNYKLIGKHNTRLDGQAKSTGNATFSTDVRRKNRAVALILRPPFFGAKLKDFDDSEAKKLKGFIAAYPIPQGVAVLGEDFWVTNKARKAIKARWDESNAFKKSTSDIAEEYLKLSQKTGIKVKAEGGPIDASLAKADSSMEAVYQVPYLAHAAMEPLNCTIAAKGKGVEVWCGSQSQTNDQGAVARILGLKPEQVTLHTTLAGGSFGRIATPGAQLASETAEVYKKASSLNRPIHLMWTREDDIKGGYYRPYYLHRVKLGFDKRGEIIAWKHRIVGQSILAGTPFASMIKNGVDNSSVEGAASLPYDVPNFYLDLHSPAMGLPVLWWRSVGHTHTALAVEHSLNLAAEKAKVDPFTYRLKLLKDKRYKGVLTELQKRTKKRLANKPKGWGYGIAVHKSFGSFVAELVEVSLKDGKLKCEHVTCVVDCGLAVNPDIIKTQVEGSIGFALAAALYGEINIDKGTIRESNFHDYRVLRMGDMPNVTTHIIEGSPKPTGIGEPAVPPFFPALLTAVGAASGKEITTFPLSKIDFS